MATLDGSLKYKIQRRAIILSEMEHFDWILQVMCQV